MPDWLAEAIKKSPSASTVLFFLGLLGWGVYQYVTFKESYDEMQRDVAFSQKQIGTLEAGLEAFKELYNSKHADLSGVVYTQGSRIDALSARITVIDQQFTALQGQLHDEFNSQRDTTKKLFELTTQIQISLNTVAADVQWLKQGKGMDGHP